MLSIERYGPDVLRLQMSTAAGRAAGYGVSAYVTRGVLIDTGCPALGDALDRSLRELRLRGVLLTHAHEDHAGNVDRVIGLQLPVGASADTLAQVARPGPVGRYRQWVWGKPRPVPELMRVEAFEDPALQLIHTPGHSSDHHVVWDEARATVFAGDLYLGARVREVRPDEEPRVLAASLRKVLALAPETMYCAHRGPVPDPIPALVRKAEWLAEMMGRMESLIRAGWSDRAVTREVFGPEHAANYVSGGDLSRRNFVRAVRRGVYALRAAELSTTDGS
jgi:glyoxylase-like metal-dependent hydrolase (beta-lactamase superfamily II)